MPPQSLQGSRQQTLAKQQSAVNQSLLSLNRVQSVAAESLKNVSNQSLVQNAATVKSNGSVSQLQPPSGEEPALNLSEGSAGKGPTPSVLQRLQNGGFASLSKSILFPGLKLQPVVSPPPPE